MKIKLTNENKRPVGEVFMNMVLKVIGVWVCSVGLVACQSSRLEGGINGQNSPNYSLAVNARGGMQKTRYVPVAMPGQMMPLKTTTTKALAGEEAIEAANRKAVKQPTSGEYVNSIMTFDYMPGALYQIYCAPLSVTDIQFQEEEHIVAVGAGDTMRWKVSKTYSGQGAERREHLLVKPIEEGITNGVVVTTDMRTYHLVFNATPKTYMASVAWRYPEGDGIVTSFEDDAGDDNADPTAGIDLSRLNFNYVAKLFKGSRPDWFPAAVFNDGKKTYIKFSSQAQEAPTLFVAEGKSMGIVNYRVQGNYYVVDRVVYQGQLQSGPEKHPTIVQFWMQKR